MVVKKLCYVLFFFSFGILAQTFTNSLGNNDFFNDANWSTGSFPEAQHVYINESGDNTPTINSYNTIEPTSIRVGYGGTGALEIQDGGYLNISSTSGTLYVGQNTGDSGVITQNGGSFIIGAGINMGVAGADSYYYLNDGLLKSSRGVVNIGGNNGNAVFEMNDGEFITRTGVNLNSGGEFKVNSSNPHYIEIGLAGSVDGFWNQASNSKITFNVDEWGVTPININYIDGAGQLGNVNFASGSEINVGFDDDITPLSGTWTVMTWDGTVTDNGLSFSDDVDTSIWSFEILDNELQITAIVDDTVTSNDVPYEWYDNYFSDLSTESDYEDLDDVDSDGDGLINRLEFVAKTDPLDYGVVNSIEELLKYLTQDNVSIQMTSGTYEVTQEDIINRVHTITPGKYASFSYLLVSGSNSNYDLTDVNFDISGFYWVHPGNYVGLYYGQTAINIVGDNTYITGLTWTEIDKDYIVFQGGTTMIIDGLNCTVNDFEITTAVSYPYGYGSYYGIGGGLNIISPRKHSGILVRGQNNTLSNTNLYSRTFGHGIFMQAADTPTISNCYVEGVMRTTDDILMETEGPAFDVGFLTRFDVGVLEGGHITSLSEDGIRIYREGFNYQTGASDDRVTQNAIIEDCVVKNMRFGIQVAFSANATSVSNCTVLGNQYGGYLLGGNDVATNCSGDALYSPLINLWYSTTNNVTADLTLIEREESEYYDNDVIAYLAGGGHNIAISSSELCEDNHFEGRILISGDSDIYPLNEDKRIVDSSGINLVNNTFHSVEIGTNAINANVDSLGEVVDYGTTSSISNITSYTENICCGTSYTNNTTIEAEDYCDMSGVEISDDGTFIGYIHDGDWVKYANFDFGDDGVNIIEVSAGGINDNASIDIYLDNLYGEYLGTIEVNNSGDWEVFETTSLSFNTTSGTHDLYFKFNNTSFNVDSFIIYDDACLDSYYDAELTIEAEEYCDEYGTEILAAGDGIKSFHDTDWLQYSNVDFSVFTPNAIAIDASKTTDYEGQIEVRLDAEDGTLLGAVYTTNTGDAYVFDTLEVSFDPTYITESSHDIFLVGNSDSEYKIANINSFTFKDLCETSSYDGLGIIEAEDYCSMVGIQTEDLSDTNENIGYIHDGDYLRFNNIDFGDEGINYIEVLASSQTDGGIIEFRSDSSDGTLLTSVEITDTLSWSNYETFSVNLDETISGNIDLYIVFTGDDGYLFNLDNFIFSYDPCSSYSYENDTTIQAESYCEMSGVDIYDRGGDDSFVGNIHDGDWIRYGNFTVDSSTINTISISTGTINDGGEIEIYFDDTLVTTYTVPNSGGYETFIDDFVNFDTIDAGTYDVYLQLKNTSFNINYFEFYYDDCQDQSFTATDTIEAEDYCEGLGVSALGTGEGVTGLGDADYIRFGNISFEDLSLNTLSISLAKSSDTGGSIEVRLDGVDGDLIAEIETQSTGGSQAWESFTAVIDSSILSSTHDIYLVGVRDTLGTIVNVDSFTFYYDSCQVSSYDASLIIEAEDYCETSGAGISGDGERVNNLDNGDWIRFANVDFTSISPQYLLINASKTSEDASQLEVRLDTYDGDLIATFDTIQTSSTSEYEAIEVSLDNTIEDTHDIYIVAVSDYSSKVANIDSFQFSEETLSVNNFKVQSQLNFIIYPNPVIDSMFISSTQKIEFIQIYDVFGKPIFESSYDFDDINLEFLSSGIYFIKIHTHNGAYSKSFLKQ